MTDKNPWADAQEYHQGYLESEEQTLYEHGLETHRPASVDYLGALLADADALLAVVNSDAEHVAKLFHDLYEALAPEYQYTTRKNTRVFDPDSPNGRLMVATVRGVLKTLRAALPEHLRGESDGLR